MQITVVGLGYVGTVAAACLSDSGHRVHVADINPVKVDLLNAGKSPIVEFGLAELISANVERGRLTAGLDLQAAIAGSEAVIVCVGTPSAPSGDARLEDLDAVTQEIAAALRDGKWRLVMLTCTVPPGTTEGRVIPALEQTSGRKCGEDFGVAFSPEFLREGTAIHDYQNPPKTVIGAGENRAADLAEEIFRPYAEEIIRTPIDVAEMVKLTDNAWHALKVTFANEIGRVCAAYDVDSHAVMDVFKADTRLNISTAYLTPGFAFGGSCLPKDLRTLTYRAEAEGVDVPVLASILPSNRLQVDAAVRRVLDLGVQRVALLGVAFKPGTDDLRESPALELLHRLREKGLTVTVHDESVSIASLVGANREFLQREAPELPELLVADLNAAIAEAEVVVVTQGNPAYAGLHAHIRPEQTVIDLAGIARPVVAQPNYHGLSW